jgi:hypothetical protein
MSEGERNRGRGTPTSVTLRTTRAARAMPLSGFVLGVLLLMLNRVGELTWIAGLILVVFTGLLWWELRWRRVVVTEDTLVQHLFFRTRTYPLHEVALDETARGIDIRHKDDRRLVHLPRGQARLNQIYEPSLSWKVALETMELYLESAKRQTDKGD